jgi:hypothetical protein
LQLVGHVAAPLLDSGRRLSGVSESAFSTVAYALFAGASTQNSLCSLSHKIALWLYLRRSGMSAEALAAKLFIIHSSKPFAKAMKIEVDDVNAFHSAGPTRKVRVCLPPDYMPGS